VSDADAVLIYLMEAVMPKVSMKLQRELRPSAMVLSNKYSLPQWTPEQTLPLPFTKRLLVYRQPEELKLEPELVSDMKRTGT